MADGQQDGGATTFCTNCKRDIPQLNYLMHHNHCHRNIILCSQCQEPVPRSEIDEHNKENHVKVMCVCGEEIEKCEQEQHDAEECSQRQVQCEYCEMEMDFKGLAEHKDFCGSRTDLCPLCNRYIFFRDKARHEDTNCRYPEVKPTKPRTVDSSLHGDHWQRHEVLFDSSPPQRRLLESFSMPPTRPMGVLMRDVKGMANTTMKRSLSDGVPSVDRKDWKNQDRVQNAMPRNPARAKEKNEMRSVLQPCLSRQELDLAESPAWHVKFRQEMRAEFQQEFDRPFAESVAQDPPYLFSSRHDDLSDDESYRGNMPLSHRRYSDDLAFQHVNFQAQNPALADVPIPCEFCQQPIPAENLIQHQSGCRPDLTCHPAPDTARSNNNRPRGTSPTIPASSEIRNNLLGAPLPRYNPPKREDSPPPYSEDNLLMIPCEFCEVLLPADVLPMHQVNCPENRTVTPVSTADPSSGSHPWRPEGLMDTPSRPPPLQHLPPIQDTTTRSKPSKHEELSSLLDPHVDDDDDSDDFNDEVETFLSWPPKPRNPAPSKSRQSRNTTSQPTSHQPPSSRSSLSDHYPYSNAFSQPNPTAVGKPKTQNTASTRHSQGNTQVLETVPGPPSPPSDEELNNSTQTRYVTEQRQHRVPKMSKNNAPLGKPKKINLETDTRPAFTSKPNPAYNHDKPPGQRTTGARPRGLNPSHTKSKGYAHGDGYHPSIPGKNNQRGSKEQLARRETTKSAFTTTTLTFDPDDQIRRLPQAKDDSNPLRKANQKQVQRRRAAGPPHSRNYQDDVGL